MCLVHSQFETKMQECKITSFMCQICRKDPVRDLVFSIIWPNKPDFRGVGRKTHESRFKSLGQRDLPALCQENPNGIWPNIFGMRLLTSVYMTSSP